MSLTKFTSLGAKNSSPQMLKRTNATVGSHTDLPVSDMEKNVQVSPFSKVVVFSIVASSRKKRLIISVTHNKYVTSNPYQVLLLQNLLPWLSATYPDGNLAFNRMVRPRLLPVPFRVLGDQHDVIQIKLAAVSAGPESSRLWHLGHNAGRGQ
jgi:hypothetical protein